jgi:hypothetical protein
MSFRRFKYALRRLWRHLRGRCVGCARKREDHKNCLHCQRWPQLCHWCGKHWSFGAYYGASPKTLAKTLAKALEQ